jgi:hypothetical protein
MKLHPSSPQIFSQIASCWRTFSRERDGGNQSRYAAAAAALPPTPNAKWSGTPHVDQQRLHAQYHSRSYTLLKWDYGLPHVLTKPSWLAHADLALARPALGKLRGEVVTVRCSIVFGVRSRTVSAEKVAAFRQRYSAAVKPGTLVVSVDECHFSERVMPRYRYSPIGERSPARSQSGSWKARSLILGIASDGQHHHQLIDGSVTRACFGEYVKSLPFPSGAVILMDNCKIHEQLDVVFASIVSEPHELTAENITGFFRHACREMTKSSGWST